MATATRDLASILTLAVVWKLSLLLIVAACPTPGYDTSAQLLLAHEADGLAAPQDNPLARLLTHLLTRLLRWDALYFVSIAKRGYVFEQEWAFGRGHSVSVDALAQALPESILSSSLLTQTLAGVVISHLCHLLSAVLLYFLTLRVLPPESPQMQAIARVAAYLHVLSPAGVFLSAPYTEALFSLLSFSGFYTLSLVTTQRQAPLLKHGLATISAGLCFALATTVRGNGVLAVLAFAVPGVAHFHGCLLGTDVAANLSRLVSLALGVLVTSTGYLVPQFIGYRTYCLDTSAPRPWCTRTIPSIFSFVQAHYWNCGFLKYWTASNVPLFLIAGPMLSILLLTGSSCFAALLPAPGRPTLPREWLPLCALAAPQLVLAALSLTAFHVQIVNRIASGYPAWYVVLATGLVESAGRRGDRGEKGILRGRETAVVRGMVVWAAVQAGLYAAFLPPA